MKTLPRLSYCCVLLTIILSFLNVRVSASEHVVDLLSAAQRAKITYAAEGWFPVNYYRYPENSWEGDHLNLRNIAGSPWWHDESFSESSFLWVPTLPDFSIAGLPTLSNVQAKREPFLFSHYEALLHSIYLSFLSDSLLESLVSAESEFQIEGKTLTAFELQRFGDARKLWLSAIRDCRKFRRIAYSCEVKIEDSFYNFNEGCFFVPVIAGQIERTAQLPGSFDLVLDLSYYNPTAAAADAPAHLKIPAAVREAELIAQEGKLLVTYFVDLLELVQPQKSWLDTREGGFAASYFSEMPNLLCDVAAVKVSGSSGNFKAESPQVEVVPRVPLEEDRDFWFRWSKVSTLEQLRENSEKKE